MAAYNRRIYQDTNNYLAKLFYSILIMAVPNKVSWQFKTEFHKTLAKFVLNFKKVQATYLLHMTNLLYSRIDFQ